MQTTEATMEPAEDGASAEHQSGSAVYLASQKQVAHQLLLRQPFGQRAARLGDQRLYGIDRRRDEFLDELLCPDVGVVVHAGAAAAAEVPRGRAAGGAGRAPS